MSVTYASALAACIARWGAPRHESIARGGVAIARWPRTTGLSLDEGGGFELCDEGGEVTLMASDGWRSAARPGLWTLASDVDDATPLPDAIDAAVRWLAEHNDPTKGP